MGTADDQFQGLWPKINNFYKQITLNKFIKGNLFIYEEYYYEY